MFRREERDKGRVKGKKKNSVKRKGKNMGEIF